MSAIDFNDAATSKSTLIRRHFHRIRAISNNAVCIFTAKLGRFFQIRWNFLWFRQTKQLLKRLFSYVASEEAVFHCGVEKRSSRLAHYQEITGSSPVPATTKLQIMEAIFNTRRDSVLKSLQENQSEIALLNADINSRIAAHKAEIAKLKLQKKELRQTKVSGGWLLSLLIRWLK